MQGRREFFLAAHINHDDAERDERDDERPVAPEGDLVEIRDNRKTKVMTSIPTAMKLFTISPRSIRIQVIMMAVMAIVPHTARPYA